MSQSEIDTLIESVEREAETHPVEIEAIRHIEGEEEGITLRVLETDADSEADQVGFQVTKPNTQMGRTVFSERLGQGFRALSDHIRDGGDDEDGSDDNEQLSEGDDTDEEPNPEPVSENSQMMSDTESVPTGDTVPEPTQEVGSFSITTELNEDSLNDLSAELDNTFEEITDELPDEARISEIEDDIDELDERLSVLEEKLAMLGSFDGGG